MTRYRVEPPKLYPCICRKQKVESPLPCPGCGDTKFTSNEEYKLEHRAKVNHGRSMH